MLLELTSTRSAQWPLDEGESVDGAVILGGTRKVRVEVSYDLHMRLRAAQHFWVFDKRGTGSDLGFYDVLLSHFPNPTAGDIETFVQRLEVEMNGYDRAKRLAEAEARARSQEELKGIKPWVKTRRLW
mgnify:CR=1 FL=1